MKLTLLVALLSIALSVNAQRAIGGDFTVQPGVIPNFMPDSLTTLDALAQADPDDLFSPQTDLLIAAGVIFTMIFLEAEYQYTDPYGWSLFETKYQIALGLEGMGFIAPDFDNHSFAVRHEMGHSTGFKILGRDFYFLTRALPSFIFSILYETNSILHYSHPLVHYSWYKNLPWEREANSFAGIE